MAAGDPNNSPMMQREQDDPTAPFQPPGPAIGTPLHRMHLWQIQAVRDLLFIAAIFGLVWLGYALRAVTIPLLVALLLAYLFEPLIDYLIRSPRWRMSRLHAVLFLLFTVVGGLAIVLALVIPLAVGQTARFVSNFNDGTLRAQVSQVKSILPDALDEELESLLHLFPQGRMADRASIGQSELSDAALNEEEDDEERQGAGSEELAGEPGDASDENATGDPAQAEEPADDLSPIDEARIREIITEELEAAAATQPDAGPDSSNLLALGRRGFDTVLDVLGTIATIGLLIFLIPFYFFFFAMSYPRVVRFFRQLLPEKNKSRALELIGKMDRVVSAFVRGRIVIAAIMGLMLAAGWILCGVPYAIVLGLVSGVFSLVPYLVGLTLPIAIALLFFEQLGLPPEHRDVWLGMFGVILWPTVVWMIVQFVETYILTPKIAGKAAGLDPVTVVVAVLAGGSLLGVYGMLLAIPLAACIKILITDVLAPRIDQWLKGERPDPLPLEGGD